MFRPRRKTWAQIGAASLIVGALASAAIGAESSGTLGSSAGAIPVAAAKALDSASLPAAANQAATIVFEAIAGGSNPSVAASRRSDGEPGAQGNKGGEATSLISAAQRVVGAGTAGTAGVRPGWGCGDPNHTHSGPPGRPNATPPPGCNK